ncbi:exodeoxyribonuclease I [Corticibacter populi]|uniref:Exodeoxyribonuclease I n=1 Tax=Corticibacter populi TaxID=1550736 RepID=A0A3M6QZH9_9BURK|nr:exodeoxyribonuclease I [Corticibacter populi]RMX07942.1 exodeoxyribonuclease I [Corticibacter populi]RZS35182.1 exodeoxyribonuclease I subunit C [Corticibacter populi]
MHTFLWHDYETFGADPRRDRPAQFAAVRTDAELREVGEPLEWFCKPPLDYLPDPQSCLITGITPQQAFERGLPEHAFADAIAAEFSQPGTVGVGYNTIRFDDEFTRFLFWRNLIDPYAREWQGGNGRWDILDVVRMTYALRPEGIEWPVNGEGRVSFRLEHLSAANGLAHEAAHDAVSDVRATIALARLLREKQPRLFDFALQLRDKRTVARELGLPVQPGQARPFVHVSGMFPVEQGCLAVMWPLASHPGNRNEIIAWNLAFDPAELLDLDAATLRQRLFTRQAELPPGVQRLPVKSIHLNKSPMVAGNLKVLTPAVVARWNIDMEQLARHAEIARALPDMSGIWAAVYERPGRADADPADPEQDLYGGFVGDEDRRRLYRLKALSPEELALNQPGFDDPRLDTLLFRYRARNYPDTLSPDEQQRWEAHRRAVLIDGEGGARTASQLMAEVDALSDDANEAEQEILGTIYDWAEAIAPEA